MKRSDYESEETNERINAVEDFIGIKIQSQQDEMKANVIARLYKNLTLEQLENLENSVKKSFSDNKKNYILELP